MKNCPEQLSYCPGDRSPTLDLSFQVPTWTNSYFFPFSNWNQLKQQHIVCNSFGYYTGPDGGLEPQSIPGYISGSARVFDIGFQMVNIVWPQ